MAYTRRDQGEQVTALNADTRGRPVTQIWDAAGRLIRPGDLEQIRSLPRARCATAPGAGPESPDLTGHEVPERPAAARRPGDRPGRPGTRAASTRRTGGRP
ncbi:MAG: hypothetical protein ACRDP5_04685 [Streptosporangiaceae bacterium]